MARLLLVSRDGTGAAGIVAADIRCPSNAVAVGGPPLGRSLFPDGVRRSRTRAREPANAREEGRGLVSGPRPETVGHAPVVALCGVDTRSSGSRSRSAFDDHDGRRGDPL